jgi:hypothetical protein
MGAAIVCQIIMLENIQFVALSIFILLNVYRMYNYIYILLIYLEHYRHSCTNVMIKTTQVTIYALPKF